MWDDISEPSAAHLHLILDIVDAVFQHFVFYFHQDSSQSDSWRMGLMAVTKHLLFLNN